MTPKEYAESLGVPANSELREKHTDAIKAAHAAGETIPENVLQAYPVLRDRLAPKAETKVPDKKPVPGYYDGPRNVASREGQMELANRAGTIAALRSLNEQVRGIDQNAAYSDHQIDNINNVDAIRNYLSKLVADAAPKEPVAPQTPDKTGVSSGEAGSAKLTTKPETPASILREAADNIDTGKVSRKFTLDDGSSATLEYDAKTAIPEMKQRINAVKRLIECL